MIPYDKLMRLDTGDIVVDSDGHRFLVIILLNDTLVLRNVSNRRSAYIVWSGLYSYEGKMYINRRNWDYYLSDCFIEKKPVERSDYCDARR